MPRIDEQVSERESPATTAGRFACEFRAEGRGAAWVSPSGELDLDSVPEFEQTIREALEYALLVIIDLRALTFIDSTGLHAIAAADQRARETEHRLVLIRGSGQVDHLFALVGLADRLKIVDLAPDRSSSPGLKPDS